MCVFFSVSLFRVLRGIQEMNLSVYIYGGWSIRESFLLFHICPSILFLFSILFIYVSFLLRSSLPPSHLSPPTSVTSNLTSFLYSIFGAHTSLPFLPHNIAPSFPKHLSHLLILSSLPPSFPPNLTSSLLNS